MKQRCIVAILLLAATGVVRGQEPFVRAQLQPSKNVLVGQPVRFTVTVYVPNYFTGSPDFPEFEIDNAIVVLPQDRPENSNTQMNGVSYAGITETYVLYPQQAGDFRIPQARVSVPYASAPPKTTTAEIALPQLSFHADVPAAARGMDYFLPTTSLTMKQRWSSPLKDLRVGDSVERTITVTALKTQAMLIPPLPFVAPDGIRVYPEQPSVQDRKTDRGDFIYGQRTQSAKYFLRKPGDYTLPALEVRWWNLSTQRLVTATLPAEHFAVAPNPNYVDELPPEPEVAPASPVKHVSLWKRYKARALAVALYTSAGLILLWAGWLVVPRMARVFQEWRKRRSRSEPVYFGHLQRACRRNDARECYVSLLRWIGVAYPGHSLEEVVRENGDSRLENECNRLGAVLYAKQDEPHSWDGRELIRLLQQQRKAHQKHAAQDRGLAALNPMGETVET